MTRAVRSKAACRKSATALPGSSTSTAWRSSPCVDNPCARSPSGPDRQAEAGTHRAAELPTRRAPLTPLARSWPAMRAKRQRQAGRRPPRRTRRRLRLARPHSPGLRAVTAHAADSLLDLVRGERPDVRHRLGLPHAGLPALDCPRRRARRRLDVQRIRSPSVRSGKRHRGRAGSRTWSRRV